MKEPITKNQFMAEALIWTLASMPVGAAVGSLGAACFTVINPATGAWLGMGVISMNATIIFCAKKIMDEIQPSTFKALTTYSIVFITTTVLSSAMAVDTFKLALTANEVLTLLAANAAFVGISLGILITAAAAFYCAAKCFCPHLVEEK